MWTTLKKQGLQHFFTRRVNQDPLENFFASVRGYGVYNQNPQTVHFTATFKALFISTITSKHSPSANCEQDDTNDHVGEMEKLLEEYLPEEAIEEQHPIDFPLADVEDQINLLER